MLALILKKTVRTLIRNSNPYRLLSLVRSYRQWKRNQFAAPSPHYIKQACLIRNGIPDAVWIETGTFLGQTTQFLSKHATKVYSVEPEPTLFANAQKYFSKFGNVEILNGASESVFPKLLPRINGDVNFWLDGHYSSGITFKGQQDTPIVDELKQISQNLHHFAKVCVLVDDLRCFNPQQSEYSTYPPLDFLVDWARQNSFHWHIEHDIFVAKN
jgi:hypothetical protein